jgi:hypothetical protein
MMTRRMLLASTIAAGGAAAFGGALLANGYRSWVVRVLQEALPGYSYEAAGLDRFLEDYRPLHLDGVKFQMLGAAETIFDARSLLPDRKRQYIGDEERDLLTEFLIGSDFFHRPLGETKQIAYAGRAVMCRSPFAVFDL